MEANLNIEQIENIFKKIAGGDIDWSARPNYLASYIAADHVKVDLAYDFSPATDDGNLAESYWATYDAIYGTFLAMIDLGTWERARWSLGIGEFDEVNGDILCAAAQMLHQS